MNELEEYYESANYDGLLDRQPGAYTREQAEAWEAQDEERRYQNTSTNNYVHSNPASYISLSDGIGTFILSWFFYLVFWSVITAFKSVFSKDKYVRKVGLIYVGSVALLILLSYLAVYNDAVGLGLLICPGGWIIANIVLKRYLNIG